MIYDNDTFGRAMVFYNKLVWLLLYKLFLRLSAILLMSFINVNFM